MSSRASRLRDFKAKGKEVILPVSGETVIMRTVSLPSLVKNGRLPVDLMARAMAGFPEIEKAEKEVEKGEKMADALLDADQFMFDVLSAALIDPKLVQDVADPEKEVILDDFEPEDQQYMMDVAQMSAAEYARFLRKQTERVSSMVNESRSEGEAE